MNWNDPHYKNLGSQKGLALFNAIIATAVIALIISGVTTFFHNKVKETTLSKKKQLQKVLMENVLAQISQPSALLASTQVSVGLRNCVFPAGTCNVTNTSTPLGQAFNAMAANLSATGAPAKRGGVPAAPTFYGTNGEICTAGNSCIYQVVTFFRAICPSNAASCSVADEIETRIVVSQRPGSVLMNDMPSFTLPPMPMVSGAIDTTFSKRTYVSEILGLGSQACSPGSVQVGVATDRHIVCRCLPEYPQIGFNTALKIPICAVSKTCPIGQEMRGVQGSTDPDPGKPICVTVQYSCTEVARNFMGNHRCPNLNQQMRASSANPFVGCVVDYPTRRDHIRVTNGSLSCPAVRISCCEAPHDGT